VRNSNLLSFAALASATLLARGLIGCGGDDSSASRADAAADSTTDAPTGDAATADTSNPDVTIIDASPDTLPVDANTDALGACSDFDLSSSTAIPFSTADGGPSEGGGGSLTPGMYQLTGRTFYVVEGNPNLPPVTRKGVMQVTSTDLTVSLDPSVGTARSVTVSYTVSGADLIEVPICFVEDGGTFFGPSGKRVGLHYAVRRAG